MFVVAKKKDDCRWQVQVVESVRAGKQVRQKIIRNVGTAHNEKEVEEFKRIGEAAVIAIMNDRNPVLPGLDPADYYSPRRRGKNIEDEKVRVKSLREEKRINEGIAEIFGTVYSDLGFDKIIADTPQNKGARATLEATVMARIAAPESKLATSRQLAETFDIKIPVHKIYRTMDILGESEDSVKLLVGKQTTALFQDEVDVLFFDVTTLYFESIVRDELKEFGFSKDCKFNQSQVTLALVTTRDGLPITYKLFPGNTYEGHTLLAMAQELKNNFRVSEMVLVADRAMFTRDNLRLMDSLGMKYVVAAKLRTLPKKTKEEILDTEFKIACVNQEIHWINEFAHEGRRLIVSYNSDRAKKDASDRNRLLARLEKKTSSDEKIKISDVINNSGTKKFISLPKQKATLSAAKIERDMAWDGLHGVITNMASATASSILERYKGLWQIEEAFRVNKHSLKMRPIFHWNPRRIRAHISLCYLAFSVVKHTIFKLKNKGIHLSFEEVRHQLTRVQASTLIDTSTKKRYVIPSSVTPEQQALYSAFGLTRDIKPYAI